MIRDDERIQTLNDIIVGISRRSAHKFKTLSAEDLSQSLWLKIIETEDKLNYPIDLDLVARICYDEVVNIQRYEMRRNAISLDSLIEVPDTHQSSEKTVASEMMIDDLLRLFPSDTPEGQFLRYWMTASSVEDFGYRPQGKYHDGYTENELAKILGFKDSSHRSYRKLRSTMQNILLNYFVKTD